MRKLTTHSKSSLFLMEMLLSLLILSLSASACIRIFVSAWENRREAREWNHIQELTVSLGEITEGWDGKSDSFSLFFPKAVMTDGVLHCYYDDTWKSCSAKDAAYHLQVHPFTQGYLKNAELTFQTADGRALYSSTITFPLLSGREVDS